MAEDIPHIGVAHARLSDAPLIALTKALSRLPMALKKISKQDVHIFLDI